MKNAARVNEIKSLRNKLNEKEQTASDLTKNKKSALDGLEQKFVEERTDLHNHIAISKAANEKLSF